MNHNGRIHSERTICNGEMHFKDVNYKDLLENTELKHKFIYDVVSKLIQHLDKSNDRHEKIVNFLPPDKLEKAMDFSLPDSGDPLDVICEHVDKILQYAMKTGHPRYFNQLWAGKDTVNLIGEWITAATNTSMYTYEIAPVYIMMEKYVIEKMLSYAEFQNGDGMFFAGGSLSNIAAVSLARYRFYPDLKEKGMFGCKPLVLYMSEEAHYSMVKAAAMLGFGTNNLVKVKADERGRMSCDDLEMKIKESISQGAQPLLVCAVAGSTVGGFYDPFNEVAEICEKYKLWMHVDAAWGGSCLVSRKQKYLMTGCERADSITWDAHKMMSSSLTCSVLLVKEKDLLKACNRYGASYLFQPDKMYDVSWDTGDKTFQCGRRVDVLKLWLMWKAKGSIGFEEEVDIAFSNAKYLSEQIKKRDGRFALVHEPQCTNVCFYYVPPSLRDLPDGDEKSKKLHKVAPEIKKRLVMEGSLMLGFQPMKKTTFNIFRMVCVSPQVKKEDLDFVLDEIERLGKDL